MAPAQDRRRTAQRGLLALLLASASLPAACRRHAVECPTDASGAHEHCRPRTTASYMLRAAAAAPATEADLACYKRGDASCLPLAGSVCVAGGAGEGGALQFKKVGATKGAQHCGEPNATMLQQSFRMS